MANIILLFCGVTLLLLAAIVLSANHRSAIHRWLAAFSVSGLGWLLANLFANNASTDQLYLAYSKAALVGAAFLPFTFLVFCVHFTSNRVTRHRYRTPLLFLPILFLLVTAPTDLNIKSASVSDSSIQPGFAYGILLLIMAIYFAAGIIMLVKSYHKSDLIRRQQLSYILLGTVLTVAPGFVFSGLLPLFGQYQAVSFAPSVVLFFSVLTSIAIIRHRLFDIRAVVARALGYGISIALIAAIYGFLVFGSARLLFNFHISVAAQVVLSVITGAAGLVFYRMQRNFDRLTNRMFYRDAYDPEVLFDDLNTILVSSLSIDYLLKKTSTLLVDRMHLESAGFLLSNNDQMLRIGSPNFKLERDAPQKIEDFNAHRRTPTIVADFLEDEKSTEFRTYLDQQGIAVVIPLYSSIPNRKRSLGFMIMGTKRSKRFYTNQDLRVLETVANELVIAVQNALHFQEIQEFNVTLQSKVEAATRQLRQANSKLQELDETKDDFISMASHQLRTPLTSVKGYVSMVLEGDAGPVTDQQRSMLQQTYTSSQRMVYLISDLLNVSRLKTGKFVIEPHPTDLLKVLHEEVDQLKETIASRSIKLRLELPKEFPLLMLDETKTRQVIMNFLDNALYYTPAGGHITLQLIENPESIELKVIDDGIGVPKAEQHHLFNKFYRAKNAQRARPDGTGLGLFMAKKVIVAQGGSILFDSKEGKGSTFGFIFSKAKVKVGA